MEADQQKAQDTRVEQLWRTLDTQKEGRLDVKGLKRGLRKIDHRKVPAGRDLVCANPFGKPSKMPMTCSMMF